MLASVLEHISDTPWPGCSTQLFGMAFTWMSSGIATMVLVGGFLLMAVPVLARRQVGYLEARHVGGRTLGGSFLEVIVLFIRDQVAEPSMGKNARAFTDQHCLPVITVRGPIAKRIAAGVSATGKARPGVHHGV